MTNEEDVVAPLQAAEAAPVPNRTLSADYLRRQNESLARRLAVRFESETKMRDTLAALFILVDWRKTTQHLSIEQCETWADACDYWADRPVDRWWRRQGVADATSVAPSEASQE